MNGQTLSWEEAIALFRDQTGRAGPSTWEVGTYPRGADDLPVGGVSWFEAAAYAAFRGKHLPTVYHWATAAGPLDAAHVVPRSNFSNKGPIAVKTSGAVSRFGLHDAAGNVREWCANELPPGQRYILGGAWNDPDYMYFHASRAPAARPCAAERLCRASRLILPSAASLPAATTRPDRTVGSATTAPRRRSRTMCSRSSRTCSPTTPFPSTARVGTGRRDRRSGATSGSRFAAASEPERVIAHLYLPKHVDAAVSDGALLARGERNAAAARQRRRLWTRRQSAYVADQRPGRFSCR